MKRRGCGICGGILLALAAALTAGIVWLVNLDPAGAGGERRTGAENYGRYNGYVEICIRDGLHGLLPDALPEGTRADYEYRYHCALLGDPAFAATLELTFDDAALYARERARLAGRR